MPAAPAQIIGLIGLGLLGRSIAACLLHRGFHIVALTRPASGYAEARLAIAADIDDLVARGAAPPGLAGDWAARYAEAASPCDFARCDFVIESVTENLAAKQSVYAEIEPHLRPDTPLATNTSALPISLLARAVARPNRFIGFHVSIPVPVNRCCEITRGDLTDDATTDAAVALGRAMGKETGILNRDIPGFIVNRLAYALYREAFHLLESGVADADTIDRMFSSVIGVWAPLMGPFRWMDLTGLPAYQAVMRDLLPALSNSAAVPETLSRLVAEGEHFYPCSPGERARWHRMLNEFSWAIRQWTDEHHPKDKQP